MAVMFIGIWVASQYAAHALAYQPQLGEPMLRLGTLRLYEPWAFFSWDWNYNAYAPDIFSRCVFIVIGFTVLGVLAAVGVALWRAKEVEESTTHGSARWADEKDLKRSGLLDGDGVVLGKTEDGRYLTHNGPEHIEVTAPSRSGKGVSSVVTTLINWRGSVIVNDIKGENWMLTARHRSGFGYVLKFNPAFLDSCRYNPMAEVRFGMEEVKDVQNITDMIVDPEGKGKPDHWSKEADAWLTAVFLHILYAEPDKTLPGVARFLDNPERTIDASLHYMLNTKHLGDRVHPVVAIGARALLNKSENERSGVHSTARSFFSLYLDPIVAQAVSESDFSVYDLMRAEHPLSLYLISPPSDKRRLRPLFRLIINQVFTRLTEELNPESNRHRLLAQLDEFPALGKIEQIEEGLGFYAGYGIKVLMYNQSVNQIIKYYGPNNTVMDGAHIHVWYAPNTEETAKKISDALGVKTERQQQTNYAGNRLAPWLGHVMVSNQETSRPLLTPGEVSELPPTDCIIKVAGLPPIRAKKTAYYSDPNFSKHVPPTIQEGQRKGALAEKNHPMNPPADTAVRPYRYGPPTPRNPWAGRVVVAPPAPAPVAAPAPTGNLAITPALPQAAPPVPPLDHIPPEFSHEKADGQDLHQGVPAPIVADAVLENAQGVPEAPTAPDKGPDLGRSLEWNLP
ncbi:conjugal transfer protein TraG [Xanthomonas theicola]|uniref:Conjugal transfer protein TraG n=3 Tax=Xanthomonas theicola TaxID=56464 RepID=A0A2S6ZGN0_9XANT|nr:conjugal transfer protein TraG [Xanthomonas theicola]